MDDGLGVDPKPKADKVVLSHDMVLWLVKGLIRLDDVDSKERHALVSMLLRADLVTLTFGLDPSCSLMERLTASVEQRATRRPV